MTLVMTLKGLLCGRWAWLAPVFIIWGFLSACDQKPQVSSSSTGLSPKRQYSVEVIEAGKKVFQTYCATCHGDSAQGAPKWRKVGPDGKYPAPPLNGNGHAWHHSRAVLKDVILKGSQPTGNMPGWRGQLSNEEIEAVISYFQSLWPEPVYAAWYEMQQQTR